MKARVVGAVQGLVAGYGLPWRLRYVLSRLVLEPLTPEQGTTEGRIGAYRFRFDLRDRIQRQVYLGFYESVHIRLLRQLLQPGDVFFDVGANVGYFSLVASQVVGATGQVHAFEPLPENASRLERAIRDNGISNTVVNRVAAGARPGSVTLYTGDVGELGDSGWASVFPAERRTRPVQVDVVTLDGYANPLSLESIRLVKIDVEGMELDVLRGMASLLSGPDAPDLFCEVWERDAVELVEHLWAHGYTLSRTPFTQILDPAQDLAGVTNLFGTKHAAKMARCSTTGGKFAQLWER